MTSWSPARRRLPLLLTALLAGLTGTSCFGQVLLLNPGNGSGTVSTLSGTAPYTAEGGLWNHGGVTYPGDAGVLQYSNGDNAVGVVAVGDGAVVSSNTASVDFTEGSGTALLGDGVEVFSQTPARDAIYQGSGGGTASVFAIKITGLSLNTLYDVYAVAGYIGSSAAARPGSPASSAHQAVFIFTGTNTNALSYSTATDSVTGAGSTVTSYQALTNASNSEWIEDNNYELRQVMLTAENPALYILVTGDSSIAGGPTSEQRAWLNAIQIVAVPEPGVFGLLSIGLASLVFRRRRVG